jgi:hypothetical protein
VHLHIKNAVKIDVVGFVRDVLYGGDFPHINFRSGVAQLNQPTLLNRIFALVLNGIYNLVAMLQRPHAVINLFCKLLDFLIEVFARNKIFSHSVHSMANLS